MSELKFTAGADGAGEMLIGGKDGRQWVEAAWKSIDDSEYECLMIKSGIYFVRYDNGEIYVNQVVKGAYGFLWATFEKRITHYYGPIQAPEFDESCYLSLENRASIKKETYKYYFISYNVSRPDGSYNFGSVFTLQDGEYFDQDKLCAERNNSFYEDEILIVINYKEISKEEYDFNMSKG